MQKVDDLSDLEEEDKVLFKGRSKPLKVKELKDNTVIIKGPNGGLYQLFDAEEARDFLISKPGDREYASYAEELRKVGEWKEKDENKYVHSDTEASIELVRNEVGFWTLEIKGLDHEADLPLYGYSDRASAEEELEKLIKKNPEG